MDKHRNSCTTNNNEQKRRGHDTYDGETTQRVTRGGFSRHYRPSRVDVTIECASYESSGDGGTWEGVRRISVVNIKTYGLNLLEIFILTDIWLSGINWLTYSGTGQFRHKTRFKLPCIYAWRGFPPYLIKQYENLLFNLKCKK